MLYILLANTLHLLSLTIPSHNFFFALVHAINKFRHYINGYEVFIHTYHPAIHYLMNKMITNWRIATWLLLLQEFNIIVLDMFGKENLAASFVCRIQNEVKITPLNENFPYEHLFVVSIHSSWSADITNYISIRKLLHHFTFWEKQNIIQLSSTYSWMEKVFFVLVLISSSNGVSKRMRGLIFWNLVTMNLVGVILHIKVYPTRFCTPYIIG